MLHFNVFFYTIDAYTCILGSGGLYKPAAVSMPTHTCLLSSILLVYSVLETVYRCGINDHLWQSMQALTTHIRKALCLNVDL